MHTLSLSLPPSLSRFDRDLKWRPEVEIVAVHSSSENNFTITKHALEEAYERAEKQHLKVKGIFITNPSNPLGTSLTTQELHLVIAFAIHKRLHIVSDEIYAGTVFDTASPFISITEALNTAVPDHDAPIRAQVHVVSSLSKDLGLPGFRVGVIYSDNLAVIAAATKMSSFGLISSQSQFLLSRLLADKSFVAKYDKENRERVRVRQRMVVSGLEDSGIACLKSNAGLFCWLDMRHLLSSETFEAEMELWTKMLMEFGLNVSPGSSCHCSEPGWFRVCFANMTRETLRVAMQRFRAVVDSKN